MPESKCNMQRIVYSFVEKITAAKKKKKRETRMQKNKVKIEDKQSIITNKVSDKSSFNQRRKQSQPKDA